MAPGAVEDFLRVARVAPDSKIRSTAQYDAAAQLINLKQWDRAIGVLEEFRAQYPKSELSADVTPQAGGGVLGSASAGRGGRGVRAIAANPAEDRKVQREALLQSADLYAKANNTPKAVSMLEKFVATNPTPIVGCGRGAPAARGLCRQEWRCHEARLLVSRDRQGRCAGGRAAHRSHALPGREGAARRWRSRRAMRSAACG